MNTEELENGDSGLDLSQILTGALRAARHLLLVGILLMAAAAAALTLYTHIRYTPYYEAKASFSVRVTNPLYASQQYYNATTAQQMAQTFPSILTSGILGQRVQQTLGISYMPAVSASVLGETNIFTLTVTASDPQLAYDVLQCVMEIYPEVAEFVVGPTTLTLLDETGLPQAPANPLNYSAAAAKGAFLGAVVWAAMAVLYWLTHQTVNNEQELRSVVNLPCLGMVPTVAGLKRKKQTGCPKLTEGNDKFGFSESIRLLRVRVEKLMTQNNAKVLMVTSTIASEGKTTVSVNLAMALAQKGKKTLLVDCDLRNPSVASAFGAPEQDGLVDFLQGKKKINELLRCRENTNLFVIYGGRPIRHPEKLLASATTRNFLTATRAAFDYVILDTPPCTMIADAADMSDLADCTLLTVRQNFACRSHIAECVQLLSDTDKPILGCVMNMTAPKLGKKYYGYYGK